jgi:hypothetical protein
MSEKIEKLKKLWSSYNKSWNGSEEYSHFIQKYPQDYLLNLRLEEYTNIKTSEATEYFTHWLERKTENCGKFRTASSYAYGIYKVNPNNIPNEVDRKNAFISILDGCQCHGTYELITCFFESGPYEQRRISEAVI